MKTTTSLTPQTSSDCASQSTKMMKNLVAGLLLTAFTLGAKPSRAQDTTSVKTSEPENTEKVEKPKTSSFSIDPTYSPTDDLGTVRFQGGGAIGDLKIGGFVDFSATNVDDGINTALGKITVAKPIGKHGTSAAIEYTLHTSASDKVRIGIKQVCKLKNGAIAFKIYPLSDQGFEPYLLIGADYKLGKYFGISSFVGTDITSKNYYGEGEIAIGSGKVQGLGQVRVGGTYATKPKAGAYVGMRIKL